MNKNQSSITLYNNTSDPAQFTVKKGDQVVVFMPSVGPGGSVNVPTTDTYDVVASTVIDGNTYRSASMSVTRASGFVARVKQDFRRGTYVFEVEDVGSTAPNQLQFQSTWRDTVTFTIMKDNKPLQDVICRDAFHLTAVQLGDTYSFQAVVNGVTTAVQYSDNLNATCTAVNDTTIPNAGYYTLDLA